MSVHIGAKKGDVAEAILLPGDPLRAKFIAEKWLENPVCSRSGGNPSSGELQQGSTCTGFLA